MITEKEYTEKLKETHQYLIEKIEQIPEMGIILGSGLGAFADLIEEKKVIPYSEIPNFPISTVEGHAGRLVFGRVEGTPVVIMQGRFHYYEGYNMKEVTFPVRAMQVLGVKGLVVTNAAGGINKTYKPGDLVLISDHINLMGDSPLRGENLSTIGPRFPDMSEAYDKEWRQKALDVMRELGLTPQEGVYAALGGPSYETPAEIRFLHAIGADLVGMSTAPEVIAAKHGQFKLTQDGNVVESNPGGMQVLGISCVTNMAAGILPQKLNHAEVMETAEKVERIFIQFLQKLMKVL